MDFPGPNSALFGYTGFVGTTLRRTLNFTYYFNSQNVTAAKGATFDVVVFCSMPAVKWLANKEPEKDMQVLQHLQDVLSSITCRQFILISTIDVYHPPNSGLDEDAALQALCNPGLHAYGKHRAFLERFVVEHFPDHCILRLPALFGLHLRKNFVYDMLHGNNVSAINRNSAFQWYDVSLLADDIQRVLSLGLRYVNLFPEPVGTERLIDMVAAAGALAGGLACADVGHSAGFAEYNLCTKYAAHLGNSTGSKYSTSSQEVCTRFKLFLAEWAMMQNTTVSCIAWDEDSHVRALDLLKLQGVRYIELAPTRFWDWESLEAAHAAGTLSQLVAGLAAELQQSGLMVSSLQAILFKKPDLCLFGSTEVRCQLVAHMRLVVDLACALKDAGVVRPDHAVPIVFGAPKNRQRPDGMTGEEADAVFVDTFLPLAHYAEQHGCVICVEPNAPNYGCNYITTSSDAKRLVQRVDHSGLRVHLDTGCMTMAGEDIEAGFKACRGLIGHVHVSEPFLAPYTNPKVDHACVVRALRDIGYDKLVSLELLAKSLEQLSASLAFYQHAYRPLFSRE